MGGRVHDRWSFVEGGRRRVVHVRGALQCDDADVVRRLALAGAGVVYKSRLDLAADVAAGRLVQLLPDAVGEATALHLVAPHRRQFSPAVQALHRWLRERLASYGTTVGRRSA